MKHNLKVAEARYIHLNQARIAMVCVWCPKYMEFDPTSLKAILVDGDKRLNAINFGNWATCTGKPGVPLAHRAYLLRE